MKLFQAYTDTDINWIWLAELMFRFRSIISKMILDWTFSFATVLQNYQDVLLSHKD